MGILLFLVGLLALGSGGVKLRGMVRAASGVSPAAVVEAAVGVVAILASALGVARVRPAAWGLVALTLGVVVISLGSQLRRVLRSHERREASEAARLKQYLEAASPR